MSNVSATNQIALNNKLLTEQDKKLLIQKIDLKIWSTFAPKVKTHEKNSDAYWCYCPHCEKGKKKTGIHNLTGLVYPHSNGDGLGFACKACGTKHPRVYAFLGKGSAAAEEYAEKRLEIGAVGKGWYCPAPQRHKQQKEQKKRDRAAKYKADYERKRRENKVAYDLRNNTQA